MDPVTPEGSSLSAAHHCLLGPPSHTSAPLPTAYPFSFSFGGTCHAVPIVFLFFWMKQERLQIQEGLGKLREDN